MVPKGDFMVLYHSIWYLNVLAGLLFFAQPDLLETRSPYQKIVMPLNCCVLYTTAYVPKMLRIKYIVSIHITAKG